MKIFLVRWIDFRKLQLGQKEGKLIRDAQLLQKTECYGS